MSHDNAGTSLDSLILDTIKATPTRCACAAYVAIELGIGLWEVGDALSAMSKETPPRVMVDARIIPLMYSVAADVPSPVGINQRILAFLNTDPEIWMTASYIATMTSLSSHEVRDALRAMIKEPNQRVKQAQSECNDGISVYKVVPITTIPMVSNVTAREGHEWDWWRK